MSYNTNKEHENVRLLAESKVATNTIIDDLLELSETEKADFKEKIANSTLKRQVETIESTAKGLSDARATAKTTIDNLEYLVPEEMTNFKVKVTKAKNVDEVSIIQNSAIQRNVDNKNEINAILLANLKENTVLVIQDLSHISETEKDRFIRNINAANSSDLVELYQAQAIAIEQLAFLNYLSQNEKDTFVSSIISYSTTTVEKAKQYLEEAKTLDQQIKEKNELTTAQNEAINVISLLDYLTSAEKDDFTAEVKNAKTKVETKQISEDAIAQDDLNKKVKASHSLFIVRTAAKSFIKALAELSEEEQTTFTNQIEAAKSEDEVNKIKIYATEQDAVNRLKKTLIDSISAAKNTINQLTDLEDKERIEFLHQVDEALTINGIVTAQKDAEAKNEVNKTARLLVEAKEKVKTDIDTYPELTQEERDNFSTQIDAAGDQSEVLDIKNAVIAQNKSNEIERLLADNKLAANKVISAFEYLSNAEKSAWIAQIDSAKSNDEITKLTQGASSQNSTAKTAIDNQAFDMAKITATKVIDGLDKLNTNQKSMFKQIISYLGTNNNTIIDGNSISFGLFVRDINDIVLYQARAEATNTIYQLTRYGLEAFSKLSRNPRYYKEWTIDKDISTLEGVQQYVDSMLEKEETTQVAELLQSIKTKVTTDINALTGLSSEEKTLFVNQVRAAVDKESVDKIQETAAKQSDTNIENKIAKDLLDKQNLTKATVRSLTALSDDEKQLFITKIDEAKAVTDIDPIYADAITLDSANRAEKSLIGTKLTAKIEIDSLLYLTKEEQIAFCSQIEQAKTVDELTLVQVAADKKNTDHYNEKVAADLASAKVAAKEYISSLTNLSDEEKAAFTDVAYSSVNTVGVDNAKTQANAQNNANKKLVEANILKLVKENAEATVKSLVNLTEAVKNNYINYIISNSPTYSNVDAVLVIQARANALNTILGLTEIPQSTKNNDLNYYLTNPSYWGTHGITVEAVEAYEAQLVKQNNDLMVAKELAKSRTTAQDAINALTGLTASEKAAYNSQVANSVTEEAINQIQATAIKQDQANKDTKAAQELNNSKNVAKGYIGILSALSEVEKKEYNAKVDGSTTLEEVDKIQKLATEHNLLNKQNK
ncbi:hypothetical protein [Enterococcus faecalis]|uniref:hypothetical protein n=1 Tax=Enterococcus faecalis TaxID=1351 RepID=UPI0040435163